MGQFVVRNRHHNQPNTTNMKGLAVLVLGIGIAQAQLKFGGGSSSSSNSGSNSSGSSSSSSGNQDPSTDTRFISTGNELIDGGILGVGAGLLGGAVLGGALNGGNNNFNSNFNSPSNPCGRRKRQADGDETNTRLFGLFGGNNGCKCGRRRKRQAPGEDEVGVRFFGLGDLLGGGASNNCGCNCGYPSNNYPSNNYPSNNYPSNNYPSNSGSYQQNCQCNNQLTFQDNYGNTHGACRRADETGKRWCYTMGGYPGCSDARQSQRFPNNPWSYQACSYSG